MCPAGLCSVVDRELLGVGAALANSGLGRSPKDGEGDALSRSETIACDGRWHINGGVN
jgi:hypothetical protein